MFSPARWLSISTLYLSCFRANVQHNKMNVTLKLPDDLCRDARHRAVDESKSLSAWIADLVARELENPSPVGPVSLLEALGDETLADVDLMIPDRRSHPVREPEFP